MGLVTNEIAIMKSTDHIAINFEYIEGIRFAISVSKYASLLIFIGFRVSGFDF